MKADEFRAMLDEMAADWTAGNYENVAARFASDIFYGDAVHYKIRNRDELLRFFRDDDGLPQRCRFHDAIFDESRQFGVAEYTYEGTRLYHGTVWIAIENGLISSWREYQYVAAADCEEFWR
jgi:hypothetical protein